MVGDQDEVQLLGVWNESIKRVQLTDSDGRWEMCWCIVSMESRWRWKINWILFV